MIGKMFKKMFALPRRQAQCSLVKPEQKPEVKHDFLVGEKIIPQDPSVMSTTLRAQDLRGLLGDKAITAEGKKKEINAFRALNPDALVPLEIGAVQGWFFRNDLGLGVFQREPTEVEKKQNYVDFLTDAVGVHSGKPLGSRRSTNHIKESSGEKIVAEAYSYSLGFINSGEPVVLQVNWTKDRVKSGEKITAVLLDSKWPKSNFTILKKPTDNREFLVYVIDDSGQGISSPGEERSGERLPGVVRFLTRSLRPKALNADEVKGLIAEYEAQPEEFKVFQSQVKGL